MAKFSIGLFQHKAAKSTTSLQGFTDTNGYAVVKWKTSRTQATGAHTARVANVIKNGYQFNPNAGTTALTFSLQ